jgi:hypothetical protein
MDGQWYHVCFTGIVALGVKGHSDQVVDEAIGSGCASHRDMNGHSLCWGNWDVGWLRYRDWGLGLGRATKGLVVPFLAQRNLIREVGHEL